MGNDNDLTILIQTHAALVLTLITKSFRLCSTDLSTSCLEFGNVNFRDSFDS